jgi:hypothetical protein
MMNLRLLSVTAAPVPRAEQQWVTPEETHRLPATQSHLLLEVVLEERLMRDR